MADNFKSLLSKLSPAQQALARRISDAGLASYTQAVKALATFGDPRISEWKRALDAQADAARSAAVATAQDFRKPVTPELPALTGFVNLTPHAVNVQGYAPLAPSGAVARCAETRSDAGTVAGVPVTVASFGAVEGLPAAQAGVYYIVSALVLAQVPERADVFAPGPALRDGDGRVVGCVGLSGTPAFAALRPTPPEDWPGGDWESGDVERRTDDPAGDAPVCPDCDGTGAIVSGPYAGVHCSCEAGVARWRIANDVDGSGARAERAARIEALRAKGYSESRIDYEMRIADDASAARAIAHED